MKDRLSKTVKFVREFIYRITDDQVSVYAAQASFFLIISAIPFMMFAFAVIKLFITVDQQTLLHAVNSFAPMQVSEFLTDIINELFDKTASVPIISITAVTSLWLASRGVKALLDGLNNVYHLQRRGYFFTRSVSVLYTLAFIAAILLTIVFFGFGSKFENFVNMHSSFLGEVLKFLVNGRIIIFFIYLTFIFALFYKFIPKQTAKFKELVPGAAIAAVGWLGFSYFYSIYIDNFSNYTYVYGSLTALVLLMLWLYFCMNIFLYGAQINKMIKNGFFVK